MNCSEILTDTGWQSMERPESKQCRKKREQAEQPHSCSDASRTQDAAPDENKLGTNISKMGTCCIPWVLLLLLLGSQFLHGSVLHVSWKLS